MHYISHEELSFDNLRLIVESGEKLALSQESVASIQKCRDYLDRKMEDLSHPVYGISTGFGSLYNVTIPPEDL